MAPGEISRRTRRLVGRVLGRGGSVRPPLGVPAALLELDRRGPAPLACARVAAAQPLHVATVIPSFRRGSGGHGTIVHLMKELVRRGHTVSLWLEDWEHLHAREPDALTRARFAEFFGAGELGLHTDLTQWRGADIVLATGWQTVPRVLLLPGARARAYLVQDHEPEFYGASAEALLAAETYRQGLHCLAASPWLAELLRDRYGATASHFDLAVDRFTYTPASAPRRDDLIVFYARTATPRRAVPLGLLALAELARRRPSVEITLFGGDAGTSAPFPHTDLGVLDPPRLAALYRQATLGVVFSLTNPSLTGLEMMACGLACVELATAPMLATFGRDGPLTLAEPAPLEICSTMEALLDDGARRARLAKRGIDLMHTRSWGAAAEQFERGLRSALAMSC